MAVRGETGFAPEESRRNAKHTLYVEGKDGGFDHAVISDLFYGNPLTLKALGPSSHMRAVAEALYVDHPHYYFLVDRDHHDDATVEKTWRRFPDPDTNNLLIWRRRELENYFLLPDYLAKSDYLQKSLDELNHALIELARQRLYFDAANLVISRLREDLKANWIEHFKKNEGFETQENGLQQLLGRGEYQKYQEKVTTHLREDRRRELFEQIVQDLTGGEPNLALGRGKWLELLKGKEILPSLINQCFRVSSVEGKILQGTAAVNAVARNLIRKPLAEQPGDFQELRRLVEERVLPRS